MSNAGKDLTDLTDLTDLASCPTEIGQAIINNREWGRLFPVLIAITSDSRVADRRRVPTVHLKLVCVLTILACSAVAL